MRTSMNLPDGLLVAVRKRAEQEGRTVTSLVEQALRDLLAKGSASLPVEPLPTYGPSGSVLLVDLDDRVVLYEVLDADGAK